VVYLSCVGACGVPVVYLIVPKGVPAVYLWYTGLNLRFPLWYRWQAEVGRVRAANKKLLRQKRHAVRLRDQALKELEQYKGSQSRDGGTQGRTSGGCTA